MDTSALIQQLERQGLHLTIDHEDRLRVSPKAAVTAELADLIRTPQARLN